MFLLVVIGLIVSIPIVIWGSTLLIKWIEKFPWIIYIGSGVLAFTAGKMITGEKFLLSFFEANPLGKWLLIILLVGFIVGAGKWRKMAPIGNITVNDKSIYDICHTLDLTFMTSAEQ